MVTKRCFLFVFLVSIFIILSIFIFAVFLFKKLDSSGNVIYCVPLISNCSNFDGEKLNVTNKYETGRGEETPYFIWEQCLNPELDPCKDFYQFACSNYNKEHKTWIYDPNFYISQLSALPTDQINTCFLRTFNSEKSNSSSAIQKMRRYRKEYERERWINGQVSIYKLIDEIESFGSCPALFPNNERKNNGIVNVLLKMTNLTGLPYLYEINWIGFKEEKIRPVIIPSRLIFSNPHESLKSEAYYHPWLRSHYEKIMQHFFIQIFELIAKTVKENDNENSNYNNGGSGSGQENESYHKEEPEPKNYTKISQELIDLELGLVQIYDRWNYFDSNEKTYDYIKLNGTEYANKFGIENIEKYLFNNAQISPNFKEHLYKNGYHNGDNGFQVQSGFLADLALFYKNLDKEVLANYLCLRYILDRMPYLDKEFQQLAREFEGRFAGQIHKILLEYHGSIKKHMESTFPLLSDHLLVTHCQSSPNQIEKAREIIKNVFDTSIKLVQNLEWLDPVSKENALTKLKSAVIAVGASEIAFNITKLDKMYEDLDFKETDGIVEMGRKLQLFNTWHRLSILYAYDNPANFIVFYNRASVINAFAQKQYPIVFMGFGALFPPQFDANQPYSNGYGTIGRLAGHEFFHLLDEEGAKYLSDSTFKSIFGDPETEAEFEEKISCIQRQYSRQKDSSGINLNSAQTLNEDISDNVAIRVSYYAYMEYLKKEVGDEKVPGYSNYTNEQSFFINFAMPYCTKMSQMYRRLLIRDGLHSLPEYRVNIPLRNFPEFSKAFNCSVGTKMNPRKKCRVWKKK